MSANNSSKKLLETLIQETIHEVLTEQMDYSNDMMYKAFVEPFTDIFATAQHGLEKITATTINELGTLAKGIAFTVIPFIKPNAGSITKMGHADRENLKTKLEGIDAKFKDVLDRNWQTFNNPDVWGTLFLMHPQIAIGAKLAIKAPEVALELLSTFLGGNETIEGILQSYKNMKTGGGRVTRQPYQTDYSTYGGSGGGFGGDYGGDYGGMYEQQQAPQQPNPEKWLTQQVQNLLRDPKINQQINSSKVVRAMQGEAVKYIVDAAKRDIGSLTFDVVKQKAGPALNQAIEKMKSKLPEDQKNKNIEANPKLQKMIVDDLKGLLKPAYVAQLKSLLQANPSAGQIVNQAIQQVNAL